MLLTDYVALVSLTRDISTSHLLQVAAAVQKQVTRDFAPLWGIRATVNAFENLDDVPNDYHPVVLFGDADELLPQLEFEIGDVGAARLVEQFQAGRIGGIHLNAFTRQPFALVKAEDGWSVGVSHEILEMLIDPYGNRLIGAAHPMDPEERVKYLVEVCDPVQTVGYTVNGWMVSDFYTPRFFDPVRNPAAFYSFTGAIDRPLQLARRRLHQLDRSARLRALSAAGRHGRSGSPGRYREPRAHDRTAAYGRGHERDDAASGAVRSQARAVGNRPGELAPRCAHRVQSSASAAISLKPTRPPPPIIARSFASVVLRDAPAVVHARRAAIVVGDAHVGEEHLVEVRVAGDLAQRPHVDARRAHVERGSR